MPNILNNLYYSYITDKIFNYIIFNDLKINTDELFNDFVNTNLYSQISNDIKVNDFDILNNTELLNYINNFKN